MSTKIEWCDEVWNPVTGCTKVSAGCKNCYAERMAKRLGGRFGYPPAPDQFQVTLHPELLDKPARWRKPRRVFVNSMSDLFHPDVPDEFIWRIFETMTRGNRRHTYMILTKRPERMLSWFNNFQERFWHYHAPDEPQREFVSALWPDPCLWLGVSVEDQKSANERLPILAQIPAAKRFVSCEPLLGPVDLAEWISPCACGCDGHGSIDWVIVGGESGPWARPMDLEWAESIVIQCQDVGIPVFVKQLGGYPDKRNRMEEWPEELRVRQWTEYPTSPMKTEE